MFNKTEFNRLAWLESEKQVWNIEIKERIIIQRRDALA